MQQQYDLFVPAALSSNWFVYALIWVAEPKELSKHLIRSGKSFWCGTMVGAGWEVQFLIILLQKIITVIHDKHAMWVQYV